MTSRYAKKKTMSMLRRSLLGDAGQALVELALVVPLLTLLFVGAAEVGRIAYASIEVNNAARAGVAYASQSHTTASDTANITLAATTEAPDVQGMTVSESNSCTCSDGTSITCVTAGSNCISPARINEFVQVNTTATISTSFHFPGIPSTLTLRGLAIMRTEQ
ncbi:hypothetical protein GCM10011507_10900 [Edaphobacter acidisoli]|uniref:TadE-like domain-containing protein n=1 Tax=Edaphobacter acidisoli TaxID=2040573 RepID=A0A916W2N7_9BACT|nr:TadE/TadG family type IV pilus assembly protein [Edaphobacter acidisoli]GGA61224.1 hypothetical protein GCM10011507_10900 [Edaphobacter acidisoli]